MFDFSWSEILLISIVALVAIGPKELPGVLRTLGQWMGKVRRMAGEFQSQFQDAMREAELADLKKEFDDVAAQAARQTYFDPLDPLAEARKEMDKAQQEVESALAGTPAANAKPADPPAVTSEGGPATSAAASQSPPDGGAARGAGAPHESAPVTPADEPKVEPEHTAGGSERG